MISKYLHLVSSTKSQITIFILLNICGLIFILLPHNIFSNMLDLELFYNKENVVICCLNCNLKRRTLNDEKFKFTKQMRIIKTF